MSGYRSKRMSSNDRWDISYSWTQSYPGWKPIEISQTGKDMAVIEAVDRLVESGLTHPDADAIIKSLINNSKG